MNCSVPYIILSFNGVVSTDFKHIIATPSSMYKYEKTIFSIM